MKGILMRYRNMSLWKKMFLGYAAVIVLPFTLFASALVYEYHERIYATYLYNEQRVMQQEYASLSSKLSQLKSYHLLFQNDRTVIRYMNGWYSGAGDEISGYLTEIRPLFAFISTSARKDVAGASVYGLKKPVVPLGWHIIYKPEAREFAETLGRNGRWVFDRDGEGALALKCQMPIFSDDLSRLLGYFELTAASDIPARFVSDERTYKNRYMLINNNWHKISGGTLSPEPVTPGGDPLLDLYLTIAHEQMRDNSFSGKGILVNRVSIPETDSVLISITPNAGWFNIRDFGFQALLAAGLFILLTALYFLIISSFTKRLLAFSKSIAKTDYGSLRTYESKNSGDEIGRVIQAYNGMITRIQKLVSDLNIAELKKREADYFALQAQMRPHFLYNSLETARMIADSNGDEEAGDFLYNLGRFIRYSFTSVGTEVTLKTELEIVGKYLRIYKASMGDRLNYKTQILCDISGVRCPPFIVQPLVENSLRHAFGENHLKLFISVTAEKADGVLKVTVKDDGKGIPAEKLEALTRGDGEGRNHGLGIGSTGKRIRDFFGERAALTVNAGTDGGTVCVITIRDEDLCK